MEGAYLPGNIRQRMQELMKEHKITQAQLATRIGSTESAISRFVSGKTDKISTEHLLRIAKVFEVSTDFLLGEVNTPDRTNFDIEELGLSVQAARNLYTGKANAEIVNRLLESPRFAEVTYMIEQYFDDTLAAGFAGQNQMLTTLSAMLRRNNKTDAAVQAARTVNRQKVPVYQADLTMIQNTFMAALREVKKEIGNDFTAAQSLTKGITQQMFTELTKGADVHTPTITPEMISAAVTQSAAGMDGVQKEALDKFGQALTEFLQSTLDDDTEHIYGGAAGSEERDRQRFHSSAVLDQGHHSADVYRTHQRGGCSYSDHHARNDFRRRHPERSGDGRCAKGSIRQVRSGADGISPIHLRPRAGEAKCRPGAMSSCADWHRKGIRLPVTFCWKRIWDSSEKLRWSNTETWGWMKMILELIWMI